MEKPRTNCLSSLLGTLCCTLLCSATSVFAQAQHGVSIFKQCGDAICVGESTTCDITVAHADQLADTTNIVEAFDIVDYISAENPTGSNIRVPASGDLPIVQAAGNTTCSVGGSLPCLIGPASSTLSGLPGVPQAGVVTFRSVYTVQANDPDPLTDQGTIRVRDLCDSPTTTNCSTGISTVQFTAATPVTRCDDGDTCTNDSCLGGVCSFDSVCDDPSFSCDDADVCTTDVCNDDRDLETPCCSNDPIVCPPLPCQRLTGCNAITGCQYTFDCREPAAPGATCCPDEVGCLIESCDPITGLCGSDPLCEKGEICCADGASCVDGNACTEDVCEEGCCLNRPIACDDGDVCTTDTCDPATGCVYTPECVSDADCSAADEDTCPDACTAGCCVPIDCRCGDSILTPPEDCDGTLFEPGAPAGHGPCRSDCTYCGNGSTDGGETCDDGNTDNNDDCSNNCTNGCGNGIVNTGETCDDGNTIDNDDCSNNCTNGCGNGIVNTGETCDDGNTDNNDDCSNNCTNGCGNGIVNTGETCDDGNTDNNDDCSNNCTNGCGNGIVNTGEACDDGNTNNNDDCSNNCTNGCGNGILNTGEDCDGTAFEAGAPPTHGACRSDCSYCGNGTTDGSEECDDGNNVDTDDCMNDCTVPQTEETCRTPGFWNTHACGTDGVNCEKRNSKNLTQLALNACGGCVEVCGDVIDSTVLNRSDSALEAMCVAPQGSPVRQLARQLTAAALNCCISDAGSECSGMSIDAVFNACNTACAAGQTSTTVNGQSVNCISAIDDFNNGRISDCHDRVLGTCSNGAICTEQLPCATGSCGAPGPAGSSNACNAATGNNCYVIGATDCQGGDDTNAPQTCPGD